MKQERKQEKKQVKKGGMNRRDFDGLVYIEGEKEIAGSVVSGLGGHEIKTSRTGKGFTNDEVPDSYYAQVQHHIRQWEFLFGLPYMGCCRVLCRRRNR